MVNTGQQPTSNQEGEWKSTLAITRRMESMEGGKKSAGNSRPAASSKRPASKPIDRAGTPRPAPGLGEKGGSAPSQQAAPAGDSGSEEDRKNALLQQRAREGSPEREGAEGEQSNGEAGEQGAQEEQRVEEEAQEAQEQEENITEAIAEEGEESLLKPEVQKGLDFHDTCAKWTIMIIAAAEKYLGSTLMSAQIQRWSEKLSGHEKDLSQIAEEAMGTAIPIPSQVESVIEKAKYQKDVKNDGMIYNEIRYTAWAVWAAIAGSMLLVTLFYYTLYAVILGSMKAMYCSGPARAVTWLAEIFTGVGICR